MATEGTNVTLTCDFQNSIPPINNVTFFENGHLNPATLIKGCFLILLVKQYCAKLMQNDNILFYFKKRQINILKLPSTFFIKESPFELFHILLFLMVKIANIQNS